MEEGTRTIPLSKREIDVRFGQAPGRWLRVSWWTWKIGTLFRGMWIAIRDKFEDLFHVDWDTDDEHYEGWENA